MLPPRYLDKTEQWTKLAAAIKGKTVGWDTERKPFYGIVL